MQKFSVEIMLDKFVPLILNAVKHNEKKIAVHGDHLKYLLDYYERISQYVQYCLTKMEIAPTLHPTKYYEDMVMERDTDGVITNMHLKFVRYSDLAKKKKIVAMSSTDLVDLVFSIQRIIIIHVICLNQMINDVVYKDKQKDKLRVLNLITGLIEPSEKACEY